MDLKLKDNSKLKLDRFTQLEYIESTGTQYLDTGIKANNGTKLEIIFSYTNGVHGVIFGADNGTSNNNSFGLYNSGSLMSFAYGSNAGTGPVPTNNTKYKCILEYANQQVIDVNSGTNIYSATYASTLNGAYNVALCVLRRASNIIAFEQCRIYSCKIYNNNALIREFIPCMTTLGTPGMYDTVSQAFFYNQGTGDFVAGPEVPSTVSGLPETILPKVTTFYHKNNPNVNGLQLLNNILNYQETAEDVVLNRIRVDIGNVSGSLLELMQYAGMAGFNDNYEPQTKPRLVGIWTVNDWYTNTQLAQAQAAFDGLTVVGDANISYAIIDEHTIHILSTTVPSVAPIFITSDITKIYIGAGSSSSNDNTLMSAFSSDSKWSSYSSLLDTWYNYLHPTT